MNFDFFTANAAMNNRDVAKVREATRMCAIARGLCLLGHDVRVVTIPNLMRSSPRWPFFEDLSGPSRGKDAITVRTLEELNARSKADFAFKTSVGLKRDLPYQDFYGYLVGHEIHQNMADNPRSVHVPFMIHDDLMEPFIELGIFGAWLEDELDQVRGSFNFEKEGWLGFRGTGWGLRKEFFHGAPPWVDCEFHQMGQPPMSGIDHARWLCHFRAAVALPGDTPKSNLPALLLLLGIPLVSTASEINVPKLIPGESMIEFESWDYLLDRLHDDEFLSAIAQNAGQVYRKGWSPLGQARLIEEKAKELR